MQVIENQLKHELEELNRQRTYIKGVAYDGIKVKSSSSGEGFTRISDAIADKEKQIQQAILNSVNTRDVIVKQIQALDNHVYTIILYDRYINNLPFEFIADALNYEYKWCCALHGRALIAFEEMWLNNTNEHDKK